MIFLYIMNVIMNVYYEIKIKIKIKIIPSNEIIELRICIMKLYLECDKIK